MRKGYWLSQHTMARNVGDRERYQNIHRTYTLGMYGGKRTCKIVHCIPTSRMRGERA